jgi:hypothetical protein
VAADLGDLSVLQGHDRVRAPDRRQPGVNVMILYFCILQKK